MPEFTKDINMAEPYFDCDDTKRILAEVPNILAGQLSMGPNVAAFEKEFAAAMGVQHAIAVNACTSALEIALAYLGLTNDDEVIVPSQTFIATAMAVHLSGGKVVFAEIEENTLCLDVDDVRSKITPHTKAVILVHFAGLITPKVPDLVRLCANRRIMLIEDAAHSPGAEFQGTRAGSIGMAGCFSFFPTKVMTCGEGGMITSNSDDIAAFARSMQHRGRDLDASGEQYGRAGRNVRMTELNALLGRVQLGHLDEMLSARRRNASLYHKALQNNERIHLLYYGTGKESSYWKFTIILDPSINRDRTLEKLKERRIFADKGYCPPVHLQPFFVNRYHTRRGLLPVTEEILEQHICLPCHPRLSEEDIVSVAEELNRIIRTL